MLVCDYRELRCWQLNNQIANNSDNVHVHVHCTCSIYNSFIQYSLFLSQIILSANECSEFGGAETW